MLLIYRCYAIEMTHEGKKKVTVTQQVPQKYVQNIDHIPVSDQLSYVFYVAAFKMIEVLPVKQMALFPFHPFIKLASYLSRGS